VTSVARDAEAKMGGVEPPIFVSGRAASRLATAAARSGLAVALIGETRGKFALVLRRLDGLDRLFRAGRIAVNHWIRQLARGRVGLSRSVHERAPRTHHRGLVGGHPPPKGSRRACECGPRAYRRRASCEFGLLRCGLSSSHGLGAGVHTVRLPAGNEGCHNPGGHRVPRWPALARSGGALQRRQRMMRGDGPNCLGLSPFNGGRMP